MRQTQGRPRRYVRLRNRGENFLTRLAVREVYYPKYSATRKFYDQFRNANKGYGGLLSVTLRTTEQAVEFFDKLETAKGPSLGTNFTLR